MGGGPAAQFRSELIVTDAGVGHVYIDRIGGGQGAGVNILQFMSNLRALARERGLRSPLHVEAEVVNPNLRSIFDRRYNALGGPGDVIYWQRDW